jgi:hypothetical protein
MSLDIFDPQKHKIVAIVADGPEKGQHLHVSLLELAMDMSKVDFAPYFEHIKNLEAAAASVPIPAPQIDLTPLLQRLDALEQRPIVQPPAPAPAPDLEQIAASVLARVPAAPEPLDLSPILDAIAVLSTGMAEMRNRTAEFQAPASPGLLPRIEALERRYIEVMRDVQAMMQAMVSNAEDLQLVMQGENPNGALGKLLRGIIDNARGKGDDTDLDDAITLREAV